MTVLGELVLKLRTWWGNQKVKDIKHEEGYAIIIKIHVLEDGHARVTYDGNITLAPKVLGEVKKMMEEELEFKKELIVKYRGKFTVIGKRDGGVLSKSIIKEESDG